MPLFPHLERIAAYFCLFVLLLAPLQCHAKTVSGDFRLTGADTEHVLGNFAVIANGSAVVRVNITSASMYVDERALSVFLFRDDKWPRYLQANMCSVKTRFAHERRAISFDYVQEEWRTTEIQMVLINDDPSPDPKLKQAKPRAHYWYVVVADCLLEQINFDKPGPMMHYDMQVFNQLPVTDASKEPVLTHFSADEMALYRYHTVALLVSGAVTLWLCTTILRQVTNSRKSPLHVTILWVTLAALLDTTSAFFELTHLRVYESNGIGTYILDALSAHFEAIADALAAVLLWSLGAGWTLSTELQERALHSTTPIARLYHDWRHPFGHSGAGQALIGPGHILMMCVMAGHVVLAQWGRIYNDVSALLRSVFNSYCTQHLSLCDRILIPTMTMNTDLVGC